MSPTYANVADVCILHIRCGSAGRVVWSLVVRPFPRPCQPLPRESADELWHEQPRPVLRAAGAPGPARGRVDADRVRAADRLRPGADIPDRERQAPAHRTVRPDVRPGVPRSRRVVRRVLRRVPHLDRHPAVVPQLGRARAAGRDPAHLAARRPVRTAPDRGLRPRDPRRQPGRDRGPGRASVWPRGWHARRS